MNNNIVKFCFLNFGRLFCARSVIALGIGVFEVLAFFLIKRFVLGGGVPFYGEELNGSHAVLVVLSVLIGLCTLRYIDFRLAGAITYKVHRYLRSLLAQSVLELSPKNTCRVDIGGFQKNYLEDVSLIAVGVRMYSTAVSSYSIAFVLSISVVYFSLPLCLFMIIAPIVVLSLVRPFVSIVQNTAGRYSFNAQDVSELLRLRLSNLKHLLASNAKGKIGSLFYNASAILGDSIIKREKAQARVQLFQECLVFLFMSLTILGYYYYGSLKTEDAAFLILIVLRYFQKLRLVFELYSRSMQNFGHFNELERALSEYSKFSDAQQKGDVVTNVFPLTASNAVASMLESKEHEPISFTLSEGEWIAIVGPSGVGKTTLLEAIQGINVLKSGTLTAAGKNVRELNYDSYAQYVSMMPAEAAIIDGSIKDNIILDRDFKSEDFDFVTSLSGLNKLLIREKSSDINIASILSRGERQRIMIARALYGNPMLLLLDEPFTGLDKASSDVIENSLLDLKSKGISGIVALHSIESSELFDTVVELRDLISPDH